MSEKEFLPSVQGETMILGFNPSLETFNDLEQFLFDNKTTLQQQMPQTHENIQKQLYM